VVTMFRKCHISLAHVMIGLATVVFLLEVGGSSGLWTWRFPLERTDRFEVLHEFSGAAVLDRDTQLIWERSPSTRDTLWSNAPMHCARKSVGGRTGWRLPSFLELITLVSPPLDGDLSGPTLPTGHPFVGVMAETYWSATTSSADVNHAYAVDFVIGDVSSLMKSRTTHYWCVLGELAGPARPPSSNRASTSI
jgi:hypothetical protein